MQNIASYNKIFVLQLGNKEVEALIHQYADPKTDIIEMDGSLRNPLQNMNLNRWTALKTAFDNYACDWVLSVEEDIEVARETLLFIEEVYARFNHDQYFRGINLGSSLDLPKLVSTYSLQRFGVHGCGTVMTKDTWNRIKRWRIERTLNDFALDGAIEGIMKTGFMVTPNVTLYLDNGWDAGTHTKGTGQEPFYVLNRKSWHTRVDNFANHFELFETVIPWREDCIPYRETDNSYFQFRAIISRLFHTKFFKWNQQKWRASKKRIKRLIKLISDL
jgi:hypothetical protein